MKSSLRHPPVILLQRVALALLSFGAPLLATAGAAPQPATTSTAPANIDSRPLADQVRFWTERFKDPTQAMAEYWLPATPCVSGPDTGAMGVHFIKGKILHDGKLSVQEPEALIYEPLPDGSLRFVGVEYIVIASEWAHYNSGPPALAGNLFNFVDKPNRYGLDPFYELHVWAWEDNPRGTFSDWNTRVTCINQPGTP